MKSLFFLLLMTQALMAQASELNTGDKVVVKWDERSSYGRVQKINRDGSVKVKFDSDQYYSQRSTGTVPEYLVHKEISCLMDICKGKDMLVGGQNGNGTIASVVHVFENGSVAVKPRRESLNFVVDVTDLSPEVKCMGTICRGDSVNGIILEHGREYTNPGKVWKIYNNGEAIVRFEREPHVGRQVHFSKLSNR